MRVFSAGTVMVDILAVGLDSIAEPGTVVYTPTEIETRIGGHPIDVAIDLVRLGVDPTEVAIAAAVGEGTYGRFVRSVIDDYGFEAFLQPVTDRDTGKNLVLQVGGEDRRFHIDPGANWVLAADHVASALRSWAPDVVTLRPGYSGMDLDLDRVVAPLDDTLVLLDVMQPHPSRPPGYLEPALRRADVVHCNEIEARVAMGASTVEEAVAGFLAHGVGLVLITAGGGGATAYTATHRIAQPGFHVDVVDVTGCGDAFCAGVVMALAGFHASQGGYPPDVVSRILIEGQAAGAAAATAVGCVEGVSADLVDRIKAEQGDDLLRHTSIETQEPI